MELYVKPVWTVENVPGYTFSTHVCLVTQYLNIFLKTFENVCLVARLLVQLELGPFEELLLLDKLLAELDTQRTVRHAVVRQRVLLELLEVLCHEGALARRLRALGTRQRAQELDLLENLCVVKKRLRRLVKGQLAPVNLAHAAPDLVLGKGLVDVRRHNDVLERLLAQDARRVADELAQAHRAQRADGPVVAGAQRYHSQVFAADQTHIFLICHLVTGTFLSHV